MEYSDIYLGLDVALEKTGIAIIEVIDRKPRLVDSIVVMTDINQRDGERLYTIASKLRELRRTYGKFKKVIRERGFSNNRHTATQQIFKSIGISDLIYRDYDIVQLTPKHIKKVIAGKGEATKKQVERGVRRILDLPDSYKFDTLDASDAAAVILTYLIDNNLIDVKKRDG